MDDSASAGAERYEVMELLGRGGMGAVYRALDRKQGGPLALKRLVRSGDEARQNSMVTFFHQEFRTLAQLAHPHVVRAYDYGIDEHGPYYTMELLEGEDLQALAPLPWREACSLVRDVCSAVALLHSRGLLHRDLSPKNVKRTQGGRAKLIDFGAMTPMGPSKALIGTPPVVPPEALLQQSLDGRADLYALGATLYFALTGSHCYPARKLSELPSLWRLPAVAPSLRVASIPAELDSLVLSLLSPEPVARPRSAAELLDRLTAIASLPNDEQLAISNAYLSTPELVGRSHDLARIRTRLRELHAGRGGALWLEGGAGMGRSRMLDACVLEAKLGGLLVARADATDASNGLYGVLSALLRQLSEALPASRTATETSETLRLLREGVVDAATDQTRRAELHAAAIDWIRALSQSQPLVLAVDDFERCDEPSQAVLASLAEASKRERVLVAVTCSTGSSRAESGALTLLHEGATHVRLRALSADETEALLGSVFGDVPHLPGLAARIHERAEGSPRGCIELAQYLVDHGLVRYRMGSWALPPTLDDEALPISLSRALRAKLDALGHDARELAEALAVAEGSGLELDAYAVLTSHGDAERVGAALDELLFAQVLRSDGSHYDFEAQVWANELRDGLSVELDQVLSSRVADALQRRGRDRLEVARYRWRAGQKARTIETLLAELRDGSRWDRSPRDYAELLLGALDACPALGCARGERFMLLRELAKVGQDLTVPSMRSHLAELFAALRLDTGLEDFEKLDASLDSLERLQQALGLAQQRYERAPERGRGPSPLEAVLMISRLVTETSAFAAQTSDHVLFDILPELGPLFPLSPAIERVQRHTVPACRHIVAGRYEQAVLQHRKSLEAMMDPDSAGVDEGLRAWSIRALHYALGCLEGGLGREQALRHAEELESTPGWLVPAFSVKRIYYGTLGNLQEAERCRKRIELLLLQSPVKPPLSAGAAHQHVYIAALADDLTGLRQAIPEMEALAALHAGCRPFVPFARAEHARVCGDYDQALSLIEQALAMMKPGEHPLWPWAVGSRLWSLLALGRFEQTRELGLRELAVAESVQLAVMKDHIEIPLALADAKLGDVPLACERLDRILAKREAERMEGVVLGWVYEARARVALWAGDAAGFERYAQVCAQQYKKSGGNPALAAKYQRLMQEARQEGVRPGTALGSAATQTAGETSSKTTLDQEIAIVASVLLECEGRQDRAEQVLTLLLERSGAKGGHLFLLGGAGLALAASAKGQAVDDEVISVVERLAQTAWGEDEATELSLEAPQEATQAKVWPLLLTCKWDGQLQVVGVAALRFERSAAVRLPMETAAAVASALIENGDAAPRALGSSQTTRSE